jgi:hypothetical protein
LKSIGFSFADAAMVFYNEMAIREKGSQRERLEYESL